MTDPTPDGVSSRLLSALRNIRVKGLAWFLRRLFEEVRLPSSAPSRRLRDALAWGEAALQYAKLVFLRGGRMRAMRDRTLFFFYDLDIAPITFDICSYLALAEMERRRRGLYDIHAVLVTGKRLEEEPEDYSAAVPPTERAARIDAVLLPALRRLPSCTAITLCADRAEASALRYGASRHVFPDAYTPRFPVRPDPADVRRRARAGEAVLPALTASTRALEMARAFLAAHLGARRAVVITLREYAYNPARNSRLADWIAFANGLDADVYGVIFVRDTAHALDPLPPELHSHVVCQAASFDLDLRMGLYQAAWLNMAIMHGPMELCWYNADCAYALFIEVGSAPQTEAGRLIENAFEVGASLPFARPWQRWYWEPDGVAAINTAFRDLVGILEEVHAAAASVTPIESPSGRST